MKGLELGKTEKERKGKVKRGRERKEMVLQLYRTDPQVKINAYNTKTNLKIKVGRLQVCPDLTCPDYDSHDSPIFE